MKHTKPTMSWATDRNHLNEQLAKYWQREYEELASEIELDYVSVDVIRKRAKVHCPHALRDLLRD